MRRANLIQAGCLAAMAVGGRADDVVFVTDIEIWTMLAPCAASAISGGFDSVTYYSELCPTGVTELQTCVCSGNKIWPEFTNGVVSAVSSLCDDSKQDLSSAGAILQKYCHPDTTIVFSTPTANIVNAYITDLAEMDYLAPCAQSALSDVVMYSASSKCPKDADLYAPCVCDKVYASVTSLLSDGIKSSCSGTGDLTQAQDFFDEYCAMTAGTTSFARPSGPPGDMSYYITAMEQFQSLNSCAQSGVSQAVFDQTQWLCPSGPQALASCACLKSGMSRQISSSLTSSVKGLCSNTATDDLSSAMDVLATYCSAAASELVLKVGESVDQTFLPSYTGGTGIASAPASTGSKATGGSGNGGTSGGSGGSSGSGDSSGSKDGQDSGSDNGQVQGKSGGISKGAIIAIAVLAIVIALGAIVGIALCVRRKKRQQSQIALTDIGSTPPSRGNDDEHHLPEGKPELMGAVVTTASSDHAKSPYTGRSELATPTHTPKPASPHPYPPPPHGLSNAPSPPPQQQQQQQQYGYQPPQQGYGYPMAQGQQQYVHELPSPGRSGPPALPPRQNSTPGIEHSVSPMSPSGGPQGQQRWDQYRQMGSGPQMDGNQRHEIGDGSQRYEMGSAR